MDGAPFWTTSEADSHSRPVRRMLAPSTAAGWVKPCRIGASVAIRGRHYVHRRWRHDLAIRRMDMLGH